MSTPRIVLYATASCPHCAAARAAIEASGESFVEFDPLSSPDVLREMLACSAAAVVPTIVVGGRALVGFDADRFGEMLREAPIDLQPADDYSEEELTGDDTDLPIIR
jgi:glutaredoxin 3